MTLYMCTYRPLPSAMSWSPSEVLLVKREGSHCMSCSEEKPRMAQLVRIPTNTIPRITSNQTPMSRALQGKGEDNQLFMNGIYDQGYIHTYIYSKIARIFHSVCLCYSMIKLVSKWIRREGEIPFLNKCLCCNVSSLIVFEGGSIHMIVTVSVLHVFVHQFQSVNPIFQAHYKLSVLILTHLIGSGLL